MPTDGQYLVMGNGESFYKNLPNYYPNSTIRKNNKTLIIFHPKEIEIIGNYSLAALALFETILDKLKNNDFRKDTDIIFIASGTNLLTISPQENYKMQLGYNIIVPEDWNKFVEAFERVVQMKGFL